MSIKYIKYPLILALLVLFPIIVPAADLPTLPASGQIRTGRLANGINYYIVTNTAERGKADIALVQKVGYAYERKSTAGETRVRARAGITDLPHFTTPSPITFMSGSGIWPGAEGYVTVSDDATEYRFDNIDILLRKNAVDSTLLMVFDIIGNVSGPLSRSYAPSNQAVIISGDVDAATLVSKMDMLSLLVTEKAAGGPEASSDRQEYELLTITEPASAGTASFTAVYRSERIPDENIGTVQPLVLRKYAGEMGIVIRRRLEQVFRENRLPVAPIGFEYISSERTGGEELYKITVTTSPSQLALAARLTASVLGEIDASGIPAEEYKSAETENYMVMKTASRDDAVSNRYYVERCRAAFLYGASLASPSAEMEFFSNRELDAGVSSGLFNNFLTALLDRSTNLHFEVAADSTLAAGIPDAYDSGWASRSGSRPVRISVADSSDFGRNIVRMKVKGDVKEPLSGGRLWTFANGIKVIFKQVSTDGVFHYTWLLKGGYGSMLELREGEGAFVSDMLLLDRVAGNSGQAFRNMLSASGITIEPEVTLSDFRLSGTAPSSKLPLLMSSLLSLANDRQTDRAAYDYYRECVALTLDKGSREVHKSVLDSIMTWGSMTSEHKSSISLADDFQGRAKSFFDSSFEKMNDGIFIIAGDFDEASLKKTLTQYIGGFGTDKVASYRSRSRYGTISGRNTVYADALTPSLDMAFSAPLDYSADNLLASTVAAYAFTDAVSAAAALKGWSAEAEWDMRMFPEERFNVNMYMVPADRNGMPASMMPTDSVEVVMSSVHKILSQLSSSGIPELDTKSAQSYLTRSVASWSSDPVQIIRMLVIRYSYGKDLMTMQKEKIASVTADKVNAIVKALAGGSIAEYAVRGVHEVEKVIEPKLREPERPEIGEIVPPADSTGMRALYIELFGGEGIPGYDPAADTLSSADILRIFGESVNADPTAVQAGEAVEEMSELQAENLEAVPVSLVRREGERLFREVLEAARKEDENE